MKGIRIVLSVAGDPGILWGLGRPAGLLGTFRYRLVRCVKVGEREPGSLDSGEELLNSREYPDRLVRRGSSQFPLKSTAAGMLRIWSQYFQVLLKTKIGIL